MVAIEITLSIAALFSMLANLQYLVSCENTYPVIAQMQYPSNMQLQALNYPPQLRQTVLQAWQHAYMAKQTASRINNWGLCSFVNSPPVKASPGFYQIFSIFLDYLSGAKSNYYQAISFSSQAYSFEIKQAEQDYIKMDKLGFDTLDSGFEKNQFEKTEQLLLSPKNPLLQSKVYSMKEEQETLLKILKSNTFRTGVNFYNEILGKNQGLLLFEQNHKQTKELISNYEMEFHEKENKFNELRQNLSSKISFLKTQGVLDMNEGFQNQITSSNQLVSFADSKPPQQQLIQLEQDYEELTRKKADYYYTSKQEDYLVKAFKEISSQEDKAEEENKEADFLIEKLKRIKEDMRQRCIQGLSKLDVSSSFYNQAFEKCNYEGNLKQSIENYNQAIKIENGNYSDYDHLIEYISSSINQLSLLGLNMNDEKARFSNLKQSKAGLQSKYFYLLELKKQVENKGSLFKQEFNQNSLLLKDYFETVEGSSIFYVNTNELRRDKQEEKLMESQEFFPNANKFIKAQEKLVKKYSELISNKASSYLNERINYEFFFNSIPSCNQKIKTTEEVILYNNLINLTDLKIKANVSNKRVEFSIPFFEKNKFYTKQFNFTSIPLTCSPEKKQEQGSYIIAEIKAVPSMPLRKAKIKFNLPQNITILSSSGLLVNSTVYLQNLNSPQEVIVVYTQKRTSQNTSFLINDSSFSNNSFFTPFNSTEFNNFLHSNVSLQSSYNHTSENHKQTTLTQEQFNISPLSSLLFSYKKAVDDSVLLNHKKGENNYSFYEKRLSSLTGLSVEEFNKKSALLELDLKNEIAERRDKAEQEYNMAAALGNNDYLERAKYWFDKGYYTRSYLYSEFALKLMNSKNPDWAFALAFVIIAIASYIALRKKEKPIENKIKRKLYSLD